MAWHGSSRRGADRRVVIGYRGAAAALLVALTAVGLAEARVAHNASSTEPVLTVASCAVLVGMAYYLGRTRPAPGTGQRLGLVTRILSVIPVVGLIYIPGTNGLYRLTKRRLYVRNIAIFAGMLVFEMATQEFANPAAAAWAVLQFVALGFAVLLSRKMPAASTQLAERAPLSDSGTSYEASRPAVAMAARLPPADGVVDVSSLAEGVRRLYWLGVSVRFGAILLALGILSRNNDPESGVVQFTWGKGITAGAGVLVALGIALLIQEDRIRPAGAVVLGLGVISVVCFVPVSFGALSASDAQAGVIGWALWPLLALRLYRRRAPGVRA